MGLKRHIKSDHPGSQSASDWSDPSLGTAQGPINDQGVSNDVMQWSEQSLAEGTQWAERGGRFACHHCDNTYSDMKGLRRHLAKVQGVRYPCTMCPREYIRLDVLRKHIRDAHGMNPLEGSTPAVVRQFE